VNLALWKPLEIGVAFCLDLDGVESPRHAYQANDIMEVETLHKYD
jgi:hypothetical protein